jgi:hypothetical protein
MGDTPKGDDWKFSAEGMLNSKIIGEQKFKEGIKLKDAVEFWKEHAASPMVGEGTPLPVIRRALTFQTKKYPTEDEIKTASEKYKVGKKLHCEMVDGKDLPFGF